MTGFQRLCLAAVAVVFLLIVVGGTVRATDSGLGCPDWPRCHGSFIPKWEKHTLIEYSHRLTASVAGFLVLGIAISAWRSYRKTPGILYPSLAALVLVIFQASLGGIAVLNELPPEVVAVHLGTALIIVGLLIYVTVAAFGRERALPILSVTPAFARLAAMTGATTLVLMIIGSYVAGADYGLACSGWPLCNGEVVPQADATSVQVHFLHRLLALFLGVLIAFLIYAASKTRRETPLAFNLSVTIGFVYVAQAMIGAGNVWSQLRDELAISHLATGTLLWVLLAFLNIRVYRLHEMLTAGTEARPRDRDLARAAR